MELATNRRRYSPRLKPLAACLAAALALGAGSVAADPNATSARLQAQDLPLVSTLNGQRPAPWRRQTPVLPISQMHHPVPMGKPTLPANTIAVTNCDDLSREFVPQNLRICRARQGMRLDRRHDRPGDVLMQISAADPTGGYANDHFVTCWIGRL